MAEAREAFAEYVATESHRLEAFRRAVASRGGPPEEDLDLSRESLEALGRWFLAKPPPGPEDDHAPHWAVDIPVDHPRRGEAWLLDGLATYLAATLRQRHPGLVWRLNEDRQHADYLRPVLGSFRGAWLWPFQPVVVLLDRARAAESRDAGWLTAMFDYWSGHGPGHGESEIPDAEKELEAELDDVDVRRVSGVAGWNAEIWISEAAEPYLGQHEFRGLYDRFSAIPAIERIAWEDREHFLVRLRKGGDLASVRESVRAAVREALAASRSAGRSDG